MGGDHSPLFSYVVIVLFYGFTGYFTNLIAIRMLFRPYEAKFTPGGRRIPFTPGVIPREKENLAAKVGTSVTQLINPDILVDHALKEENLIQSYRIFNTILDNRALTFILPNIFRQRLFQTVMESLIKNLPQLLDQAHIDQVISESLKQYDARALETLVLNVAHRELKAITWLGALLGTLLGIIQILTMEFLLL